MSEHGEIVGIATSFHRGPPDVSKRAHHDLGLPAVRLVGRFRIALRLIDDGPARHVHEYTVGRDAPCEIVQSGALASGAVQHHHDRCLTLATSSGSEHVGSGHTPQIDAELDDDLGI